MSWNELSRKTEFSHPVLQLDVVTRTKNGDKSWDFLVLNADEWVNVIPITPEGQVVLIEQWRHGTEGPTLEIPGGIVDPGETPEQAGARELEEETGYRPQSMEPLGWVHPNPALFNNRCHTFLAKGARPETEARPEDTEDIKVVLAQLSDIPAMVAGGAISHSLVISAFAKYWLKEGLAPVR